jgi:hypothetical protein
MIHLIDGFLFGLAVINLATLIFLGRVLYTLILLKLKNINGLTNAQIWFFAGLLLIFLWNVAISVQNLSFLGIATSSSIFRLLALASRFFIGIIFLFASIRYWRQWSRG